MFNLLIHKLPSKFIPFLLVVLLIFSFVVFFIYSKNNSSELSSNIAIIHTNFGDIKVEVYIKDKPITAGNFEGLAKKGFYNGVIFHRIIEGFVIQGGDPTGTGMGGPGYNIKDEFGQINRNDKFTLSMANSGPNTGGSQFFINLANNNFLDDKHPVFGKVVEGFEVVEKIAKVKTDSNDKPIQEVKIISIDTKKI